MTIDVSWGNPERTVIRMDFAGDWTYDEVLVVLDGIADMLDAIQHPAITIIDMRSVKFAPNISLSIYRRLAVSRFMNHPNLRVVCLLGVQTYVRMLAITFSKLFPEAYRKFRMVETVEEALQHMPSACPLAEQPGVRAAQ